LQVRHIAIILQHWKGPSCGWIPFHYLVEN